MGWKQNSVKIERVNRFGAMVDLPLFDQKTEREVGGEQRGVTNDGQSRSGEVRQMLEMPSRIFDATASKAKVFEAISKRLPKARFEVFQAIFELGSATDQEVAERLRWETNRVTPRRNELNRLGLITPAGEKVGKYKHLNAVWRVNSKAIKLMLE